MFCTVDMRENSVVLDVEGVVYVRTVNRSVVSCHIKVDLSKVKIDVIKPWITRRITEILGFEDDVVIDFCFNLLEKTEVGVFSVLCR